MQTSNLKPLTSLRFFAAAWVVFYDLWPKLAGAPALSLIEKGYLGVELFFVLSGFILCHVYLQAAGEGRFNYTSFLWARLARVYPLHLTTLLGLGLLALVAGAAGFQVDASILSWTSLPANLTLTQAWGLAPEAGWNHPSWSISAEWFAYLSFPLFAAVAWKVRNRPYVAVAGAVALLAGLYAAFPRLAGFDLDQATIAWGALRIVPCFAYGCTVYLLWRSGAVNRRVVAVAGAAISGAGVAVAGQAGAADTLIVTLFGPLILCLAALTSTGSKLGSSRIMVYLGEISFAMYMVCIPWSILFVNIMARIIQTPSKQLPLWSWLILLIGVVPIAAAAHELFEKPARERMKTWAGSWPHGARKGPAKIAA
ncbi:MAG TPA: acyltransferase [Caulobacteraceae bacterium]|nr:acyltransferase [Caulobacteraceae bacterium]